MPPRFPADYVAGHNRARRKRLNCERDGDVLGLPTFPLEAGEGAGVSAEQPSSGRPGRHGNACGGGLQRR